jgi:hypothetical protein
MGESCGWRVDIAAPPSSVSATGQIAKDYARLSADLLRQVPMRETNRASFQVKFGIMNGYSGTFPCFDPL